MERKQSRTEDEVTAGFLSVAYNALMKLLPKRKSEIKLPPVSADTDFEYALPYAAWRGPAPSIVKALETDRFIREKPDQSL